MRPGCHSRVLVVGRVCRWWGLVMGAHARLCCLVVCLCSSLAGDGSGCLCSPSPLFVLPGCALPFSVGGGCLPLLLSPRWVLVSTVWREWWWVLVLTLTLIRVTWLCAPVGGGCSDLFVWCCWVLMSAIGGGWWWALAPICAPYCVLTPVHVASCVSLWLCLLVGSCLKCMEQECLPLVEGQTMNNVSIVVCHLVATSLIARMWHLKCVLKR